MKITRVKIEQLFGYINKDIRFNPDLTLLVGINGAGKTSILNVVNWMISPSISDLCITQFKKIKLWFDFEQSQYEIECEHLGQTLLYKIKSNKKTYTPLKVNIVYQPALLEDNESLKSIALRSYKGLKPDETEKETWEFISKLPSPTIIGLDRKIFTEESTDLVFYDESQNTRQKRKKANYLTPLDRVKDIINIEYRKRRNEILNLTNRLKNHLMISAFDGSITIDSLFSGERYKLNKNQISTAEHRVNEYFENIERGILTEKEKQTISNYFSQLQEITNRYNNEPNDETVKVLYGLNAHQFVKIRNLLKEFEKFEKKSSEAMSEIDRYIKTLNYFFKDSAKEIVFKEDTAEIAYNNLDKDFSPITFFKDVNFLSSGEQQILILFTYIAFNSQDGRIFIIDEPELSLHIKWQEDFLEKLELITPESTQLLLATHSPILANKKKDKAITLLPYNT